MQNLLDEVKLRFPHIHEDTKRCYMGSKAELIMITNDGRTLSYNDLDKTIRGLPRDCNQLTKEECQREFGIRLYNMMWIKGMTQAELSEITGISQPRLSEYITGEHTPSFYNADKIAKALGCSMEEFRYVV